VDTCAAGSGRLLRLETTATIVGDEPSTVLRWTPVVWAR